MLSRHRSTKRRASSSQRRLASSAAMAGGPVGRHKADGATNRCLAQPPKVGLDNGSNFGVTAPWAVRRAFARWVGHRAVLESRQERCRASATPSVPTAPRVPRQVGIHSGHFAPLFSRVWTKRLKAMLRCSKRFQRRAAPEQQSVRRRRRAWPTLVERGRIRQIHHWANRPAQRPSGRLCAARGLRARQNCHASVCCASPAPKGSATPPAKHR